MVSFKVVKQSYGLAKIKTIDLFATFQGSNELDSKVFVTQSEKLVLFFNKSKKTLITINTLKALFKSG